ncbi:CheR family methyltransferase [Liquorilactobacillus vini]|uniref:protein-glutamate O-methyltransferase n=2 Tax=Liquorilactobacillus vini DSM 20605 TaxID=1133569 RepID=A0A0A7RIP8_9LACO|nr:protein-glutamate O-methyltransferase CheR [Liquorilactobacillus vini]AJA34479.1 chemotaxis protein methyltransferase CheR [Liquorilactobacillus vini DSM 20605]
MELNFDFFNRWVQIKLGIKLSDYKQRQMQRRIGNIMRETGAQTLEEYAHILERDKTAREAFVEHLTINVTEFYRNKELFKNFEKQLLETVIPNVSAPKIWSAACSDGAEPYTLAIIAEKNHLLGTKIVATDIDDDILKKAHAGIYRKDQVKNLSLQDLKKYFDQVDDSHYQIKQFLKKRIVFKKQDLLKNIYEQDCNVIVCRNVTIYFKPEVRDQVYQKFSESLAPGGILFSGATEAINFPEQFGLRKIDSFIYQKV